MGWTYKDAGVDIDAGGRLVERIRPFAARATRPEVLAGIGGFAGACALPGGYRDPILVSGTDGVGTKLKTAFATGRHDTIGVDLVAMSVNEIGAAHVTGGGLVENPPRMLPGDELAIELDPRTWQVPAIFSLIGSAGVAEQEMRRTFNLGLGMVVAVGRADLDRALRALGEAGQSPAVVGAVRRRAGGADAVAFI